MTSFIINAQVTLTVPELWKKDSKCAFCQIIDRAAHAYRVYEDDHIIALLGEYSFSQGDLNVIIISQGVHLQIYYRFALDTRSSYLKSTVREFLNFLKNMQPL
jgi:diadenosine tetraphosphate (Ap4A) HIT family hydrolase